MSSKQQETRHEGHNKAESESPEPVAGATDRVDQPGQPETADLKEKASAEAAKPKDAGVEGKAANRVSELEKELAAVREELSAVNDKYLRKLADDVNFRKRMAREKEEGQRYAVAALLGDLIPVLDDFDRAIASAETQRDYGVLHDGIALIRRQFGSVLESKYGLVRFESKGKPFDPNVHEAVAMVQGGPEDGAEAVVAEEFLPGYGLHERVLRTAKVRVRMPAPAGAPAGGAPNAGAQPGEAAADKQEN